MQHTDIFTMFLLFYAAIGKGTSITFYLPETSRRFCYVSEMQEVLPNGKRVSEKWQRLDGQCMESIIAMNSDIFNQKTRKPSTASAEVGSSRRLRYAISGRLKAIERKLTVTYEREPSKNSISTKGERKNFLKAFVNTTTVHGLDQIFFNRNLWVKLFWFALTTFVTLIFCHQLTTLLLDYLAMETVTIVRVKHPHEGIPFPHISLCLMSTINRTRAAEKFPKLNDTLLEYASASFTSPSSTALYDYSHFANMVNIDPQDLPRITKHYDNLDRSFQSALGNYSNLTEFIETVSFTCRDMFSQCWVENGAVFDCCTGIPLQPPSEQGNNSNTFMLETSTVPIATMERYLIHSGACFQLNLQDRSHSPGKIAGPVGGFGFVLHYPNAHLLQSAFKTHLGYALHLYTSQADAILERSPTILSVGHYSHVRVKTVKKQRVDIDVFRKDKCKDPKLKYLIHESYSYSNCQAECAIDVQIENCNCTGVTFVGIIPRRRTCSPKEALLCNQIRKVGHSKQQREKLVKCRIERCREPCDYWVYYPTLTMSRVFNPTLEHLQMQYWGLDLMTTLTAPVVDSLVIGEIYFDEIEYTVIEEKPSLTFMSFLSSIGGTMGFWTGASIISLVHLGFFCVYKCCTMWNDDDDTEVPQSDTAGRGSNQQNAIIDNYWQLIPDRPGSVRGHDSVWQSIDEQSTRSTTNSSCSVDGLS